MHLRFRNYLNLANGVEIEFPLDRLKPYAPPTVVGSRTLSGPLREKLLSPTQKTLLASIPAELTVAVAKAYDTADGAAASRPSFAALPDSERLEVLRIYLPSLLQQILLRHMNLVVAVHDLGK